MKYLSMFCIVSCLLIFNSCNNDKTSSSDNSKKSPTFLTANINGEKFVSSVKIVTFRAGNQTLLTTADNPNSSEFAFKLIIENDKANDPEIMRYGFVEKADQNGENKIIWKLPNNFIFNSKLTESGNYLEGDFSFKANSFDKGVEDRNNQLVVANGKFRAITTKGQRNK